MSTKERATGLPRAHYDLKTRYRNYIRLSKTNIGSWKNSEKKNRSLAFHGINSNAKLVKFHFDNFCYHNFKARLLKTRYFCL